MKFGKELAKLCVAHPRYKNFYLDYKELKRAVNDMREKSEQGQTQQRSATQSQDEEAEGQFKVLLRNELEKINNFVELQYEVINGELNAWLRTDCKGESDEKTIERLDKLAAEVVTLDVFMRANFRGFQKILKKCDKRNGTDFISWFMPNVQGAPFRQWDLDVLLKQLGQLYATVRARRRRETLQPTGSVETFFVPPELVMETKVALLRRLHPGTFDEEKQQAGVKHFNMETDSKAPLGFVQRTTRIYFDGPEGTQYAERLKGRKYEQEGSETLLSCGWVGDNKGSADFDVQVRIQDRRGTTSKVTMKQRHAQSILRGEFEIFPKVGEAKVAGQVAPDRAEALVEVLNDVQTVVSARKLHPSVSATFRRSTFVDDSDLTLFAIMDEEMIFADQDLATLPLSDQQGTHWCRIAQEPVTSSTERSTGIPHAILSVRIPGGGGHQGLCDWLGWPEAAELRLVSGFSKSLHGAALFHEEIARPLPTWLQNGQAAIDFNPFGLTSPTLLPADSARITTESASPPQTKKEVKVADAKGIQQAPEVLVKSSSSTSPAPRRSLSQWCLCMAESISNTGQKDAVLRVEVKTPMANERTLLRWLRSAVLLSTLSAFLSSRQHTASQLNGILLAGVSLLFVFWPMGVFRQRSLDLARSPSRQPVTDKTLSQVLALSLITMLVCVLIIQALFSSETSPLQTSLSAPSSHGKPVS